MQSNVYAYLKICTVAFEPLQAVSERFSNGSSDEAWVVCARESERGWLGCCQLKMVHTYTMHLATAPRQPMRGEPKKLDTRLLPKICAPAFKVGRSVLILSINPSFQDCNTDGWGWLLAARAKINNVRMRHQAYTMDEVAYLVICLLNICTSVPNLNGAVSTVKLQRRDCCARNMSGLCMQRRCSWSPQEGWRSQKSFIALWNVCTLDIERYEESVVENSRFCENVFFFTLEMPLAPQSQKPNLR